MTPVDLNVLSVPVARADMKTAAGGVAWANQDPIATAAPGIMENQDEAVNPGVVSSETIKDSATTVVEGNLMVDNQDMAVNPVPRALVVTGEEARECMVEKAEDAR